jgi:hypothetical protein
MFHLVQLQRYNPKINHLMRSYTSARGTMYTSAEERVPSWRQVSVPAEIAELRQIPQFRIETFDTVYEMDRFLGNLAQRDASMGGSGVQPMVVNEPIRKEPVSRTTDEEARRIARAEALLTPTPLGEPEPPAILDEADPEDFDLPLDEVAPPKKTKEPKIKRSTRSKRK